MNHRILLVGQNPSLLATRVMLLSGWTTVNASPAEATQLLSAESFAGLVICNSVETHAAEAIIAQAKATESAPAILAIRLPWDAELPGARNHVSDLWESPAWLGAEVSSLLANETSPSEQLKYDSPPLP